MKKIYDPLHGFIHFDLLEARLIDSLPFQRLHWIHQLGPAHLVYPGGTHTRFEHSLGAMEVATHIYDAIFAQFELKRSQFPTWVQKCVPKMHSHEWHYWRKMLRMAALCHDLGHLPFSHVAEKRLLKESCHESLTAQIIESDWLKGIWKELGDPEEVARTLIKISVGPKQCNAPYDPWERILSEILTGDFFGADRIDYLLRDAHGTGVVHGAFDFLQLIETMRLIHVDSSDSLVLGVDINGLEASEALLLARYFMHKRIYQHPSVKVYNFHLARFMERHYREVPHQIEDFIRFTDPVVQHEIQKAAFDPDHPQHLDAAPFLFRDRRFKAISLPKGIGLDRVIALQKKLDISDDLFGYEIASKETKGIFDILVLTPGGLRPAHMLSEIVIPLYARSWIFVPKEFEVNARENIIH